MTAKVKPLAAGLQQAGAPAGGFFVDIAVAWLDWQLKGDAKAGKMFKGKDCTLCTASSWHVTKKRIEGSRGRAAR